MDTARYIIYEGSKFTVEWYYTDTGKVPGLEYFNSLDKRRKVEALQLFKLMAEEGKILNITKFRHEEDGIYAFKPKPHRYVSSLLERKSSSQMVLKRSRMICQKPKKKGR